jgi:uncharacterized membrane protein YbaN (DUF454 family)
MPEPSRQSPFALRVALWTCGALALALGLLGVLLPGLPTTPFVLLAGACFVRASPRTHAWLLGNRIFGPILRDWERHHSVPRRVKWIALGMMLASVSVSLWFFAGRPWLQWTIAAAAAVGVLAISRIPSRD